ncbi:hypothetical protein ANO11243_080310 [Dothideomycetidae sp. 11243]|nr:hypothetical protein ANO11243_080310 [fungal sp. No.11243]
MSSVSQSGPPPTPVHHIPYNGYLLRNVAIAFTVLETIFVVLRFVSKKVGRIKYGGDDWLMGAALILCLGFNASALVMLRFPAQGHHIADIIKSTPQADIVTLAKFNVIAPILYPPAANVSRLAILVFYRRMLLKKTEWIALHVMMVVLVLKASMVMILAGVSCRPFAYTWDKTIHGTCLDTDRLYQIELAINVACDVCLLLLPLPMIWALHVNTITKIGVLITFLTGSI